MQHVVFFTLCARWLTDLTAVYIPRLIKSHSSHFLRGWEMTGREIEIDRERGGWGLVLYITNSIHHQNRKDVGTEKIAGVGSSGRKRELCNPCSESKGQLS